MSEANKVASRKSKVEGRKSKVASRKLRVSYPEYPLIGSGTEWGTKKGEMISHFSFYDYTSSRINASRSP